jgi:serine/threonine protein kinase/tetratricopeptide (TPR) repeat protein
MIGKTVSHYRIVQKLGDGGMGVVYKAEDTRLKRVVALKFLPPDLTRDHEAKARFLTEAQAASALQHNNICAIHEIDETDDGQMFICMDYYEGRTLKGRIADGPLPVDETIGVLQQLIEGLTEAHSKRIFHRDIKPANILLTPTGVVKIVDFGLARLAGGTKLTKTGTTVGTVPYMSPEQAKGEDVDGRTDIWSLGVVAYEMLTGQLPFKGDHEQAITYNIVNESPIPITALRTGVPIALERIVSKCLEKERADRYQHVEEIAVDLRKAETAPPTIKKKRAIKYTIPAGIVFFVAVAVLIFKPFKFEVGPDQPALAEENHIAVMYFENLVDHDDKDRYGEIATNLLITNLSEFEDVKVVSSQRLYDILKIKGKEGSKAIDRDMATKVASHAGAGRMLLGSILQIEPNFLLTAQLVDVRSGEVQASQRITGDAGEPIFSVMDELSEEVRRDLRLPGQRGDKPLAEVTTHSTEAYRHYVEGMEYFYKFYGKEAKASFEKALEYDSTFAMAYLRLAEDGVYVTGTQQEKQTALAQARRLSDRLTNRERLHLESLDAWYKRDVDKAIKGFEEIVEGDPGDKPAYTYLEGLYNLQGDSKRAIETSLRALRIDPLDKLRYNALAYAYSNAGDEERAMWAINEYIKLAPDEPNPYDTRGDLYAGKGEIDQAIASYETALEKKPDFPTLPKLGVFYAYKGEFSKAEACFRKQMNSSDASDRSEGRGMMAAIPLFRGDLDRALDALSKAMVADEIEGYEDWWYRIKMLGKCSIYIEMNDYDAALVEANRYLDTALRADPNERFWAHASYVRQVIDCGEFARADEALKEMHDHMPANEPPALRLYERRKAWLALHRGNVDSAVRALEDIVRQQPQIVGFRYDLALAYYKQGRFADAAREFETTLQTGIETLVYSPDLLVKAYYFIGSCYDRMGRRKEAITNYERFLEFWANAHPAIEKVPEAKQRLAALKAM